MKKRLLHLATFALCVTIAFPSCGDDDPINGGNSSQDDENSAVKSMTIDATAYDKWVYLNLADGTTQTRDINPVAGGYNGALTLNVAGDSQGEVKDLKLDVSPISKDSVNLILKGLSFGKYGMVGDIVSGAKIVVDSINGKLGYSLVGGEVITTLEKYSIKAKSHGGVVGKKIMLSTTLYIGAMPMPIEAVYNGEIEQGFIDETAFQWDLAFHRWDVKTNGGLALESSFTSFDTLKEIPEGDYVPDEEVASIMFDNSGMASGKIGYATGFINPVLSRWMNVDTRNMPPSYTMSDNVYLLKLSGGKIVKIKFTDYTDDKNTKGHISFDYIYPNK